MCYVNFFFSFLSLQLNFWGTWRGHRHKSVNSSLNTKQSSDNSHSMWPLSIVVFFLKIFLFLFNLSDLQNRQLFFVSFDCHIWNQCLRIFGLSRNQILFIQLYLFFLLIILLKVYVFSLFLCVFLCAWVYLGVCVCLSLCVILINLLLELIYCFLKISIF